MFLQGDLVTSLGGGDGDGKRIDKVWNLATMFSKLAKRWSEELCYCSWCFEQIFKDRECFLLPMKCMMSASVEIIFYWVQLIILVGENEPKLKEMTVNYFVLRHQWSIEEYTCENSESVKTICQNRMGFSYIFSLSCLVWLHTVFS